MAKLILVHLLILSALVVYPQPPKELQTKVTAQATALEPKIIEWRRHFHQNPELSNREFKTGEMIAGFLKSLGMDVQYPVAKTGVVGILRGAKPGPVIALRADMDALPVTERNDLPFISKVKTTFNDQETGAMHACGHDSHMAMLMGVAEVLSQNKSELKGTIKFIFQPAEEGAPKGEEGGAELMVKEGVLENPKVDVIFGLHIISFRKLGTLGVRPGPFMAAVDGFDIVVKGKGAHGAKPWDSVDPVVISSQIVTQLQTIVSRKIDITRTPVVVTVGTIHAGVRRNIIPESAKLEGTIRTYEPELQAKVHEHIMLTAKNIAEASGASAEVSIFKMFPVTYNDPALTEKMMPTLKRTVGAENVVVTDLDTGAEDFSFFQQKVPGVFMFLGAATRESEAGKPSAHHTADFMIDEAAFVTGTRTLLNLTLDYMFAKK